MDRYAVSCNTLNDLSNEVCTPNKSEHLHLGAFYMVTEISNSNQKWSNGKYQRECKDPKKHNMSKKYYIWNPAPWISKKDAVNVLKNAD